MKKNWFELVKSVTLVGLVTLSIVLTGFLWLNAPSLNSPSFDDPIKNDYFPPYIFNDKKYNQKKLHQLAAPYQVIVHYNGHASWLLPENEQYTKLIDMISKGMMENESFTLVNQPHPDQWNELFHQLPGVELYFPEDTAISTLDPFFQQALTKVELLNQLETVSRIWIFTKPSDSKVRIWFISDREQKIVQASVGLPQKEWIDHIAEASQAKQVTLTAHAANGKNPWDPANEKYPFSRIFYLPSSPVQMNQLSYNVKELAIDDMKVWLFKDPAIEPINLNRDEKLFMHNDQLLTYNQKDKTMVYKDTTRSTQGMATPSERLDSINNFIQRHRGWSGNFLLDTIETEDDIDRYYFRLFANGLPVYVKLEEGNSTHTQTPLNQIILEASGGGVRKYTRSVHYLSGEPTRKPANLPGKDELLSWLNAKKIDLNQVERIFPGYMVELSNSPNQSNTKAILNPVWVIIPTNQELIFFSSP